MLCPLVRWQISSALDGGRRSRLSVRHLEGCDRCRAFTRRMEALHERLLAGAASAPAPLPPEPGRRRGHARAGGALALAGAMAVALWVLAPWSDRGGGASMPRAPVVRGEAPVARAPAAVAPSRTTRAVVEQASSLLAVQALRGELAALASDGERGALAVLDLAGVRWGGGDPEAERTR